MLFVCSGNMVRSAFAELYARHLGIPITVHSAATTFRNDSIFPETADPVLEGADFDRTFARVAHCVDGLVRFLSRE